jgi:N-dimethylarginine dimethylaminohydrolase
VSTQRWVLMGDPAHFSVKGGANPHTRTRWGTKRQVDRDVAIGQWHALKQTLEELGIRVFVVPPVPDWPGTVYPANAGFLPDIDTPRAPGERVFHLANLLPTRAGEKPHHRATIEAAGIPTATIDESLRFEGEADFFPAGDVYLLTHGTLEKQRFVPTWAMPPWKRVYGFRTDIRIEPLLEEFVDPDRRILRVELTDEAHYHGDTVLSAFGPGRRFLLGYREAIHPGSWTKLEAEFGPNLIPLARADAERYAANSFTYTTADDSYLVLPAGVSRLLLDTIRARDVTPIEVDVSEFLKKGGGSVKCMIGDLGCIDEDR